MSNLNFGPNCGFCKTKKCKMIRIGMYSFGCDECLSSFFDINMGSVFPAVCGGCTSSFSSKIIDKFDGEVYFRSLCNACNSNRSFIVDQSVVSKRSIQPASDNNVVVNMAFQQYIIAVKNQCESFQKYYNHQKEMYENELRKQGYVL